MILRLCSCVVLLATSTASNAASYSINWLDMSVTSLGGTVTTPSLTYILPGYGNVEVTYTSVALNWKRNQSSIQQNGSVLFGADTYSWTSKDSMDAVNFGSTGTAVDYTITFTLLDGPIAAGQLVLGAVGLGQTTVDGLTRVNVLQNGTFLNDFDLGANLGPTDFAGGVGNFTLTNSLSEPTVGHFNTDLGITRIDDSISSLTLQVHHIGQDGIGFNIGRITPVPEPAVAALISLCLLGLVRRQR